MIANDSPRTYKGCLYKESDYETQFDFDPYRVAVEVLQITDIPRRNDASPKIVSKYRAKCLVYVPNTEEYKKYLVYAYGCFLSLSTEKRKQTYFSIGDGSLKSRFSWNLDLGKLFDDAPDNTDDDEIESENTSAVAPLDVQELVNTVNDLINQVEKFANTIQSLEKDVKNLVSSKGSQSKLFLAFFLVVGFIWYTSNTANQYQKFIKTEIVPPLNDHINQLETQLNSQHELTNSVQKTQETITGKLVSVDVKINQLETQLNSQHELTNSVQKTQETTTGKLVSVDVKINQLETQLNSQHEQLNEVAKKKPQRPQVSGNSSRSGSRN